MTRVVLLQNLVPPYRWPFINGLSAVSEFDVTVLHSDPSLPQHALDCNQRHVSPKRFMGLTDQPGSGRLTRSSDVVIAMFDLRWIAMWREALTRPRALVLWGHGYGRSRLGGKIRTALAHRAAHLITYEESGAEAFRAMGVESERITVAGNTVDVPNHGIVDERRDVFLFVGRLQERKNIAALLEAYSGLCKSERDTARVVIVGDGEQLDSLRKLAARLDIEDKVEILGEVRDEEALRSLFARALAYVSPGDVGLGVLHSFAYGVPVVTTSGRAHGPEFENIRNGINGLVCTDSVSELRECLHRLATEPDLSLKLGRAAYECYSRDRSMPQMVERFGGVIRSVAAKSGSGA